MAKNSELDKPNEPNKSGTTFAVIWYFLVQSEKYQIENIETRGIKEQPWQKMNIQTQT